MLELTLVRHASTALNEARRYQGWVDPPLSERGRAEALRLRCRLRSATFERILCSDLLRCRETLQLALPACTPETDSRLRELHFGEWDGRTYEECRALDPLGFQDWIDDPTAASPPEGEPFAAFRGRVDALVDTLAPEGGVLIVTHGGPIRRMLTRALKLDWTQVVAMQLAPGGITRLAIHPGGGHLLSLNDTAHLEAPVFSATKGTAS